MEKSETAKTKQMEKNNDECHHKFNMSKQLLSYQQAPNITEEEKIKLQLYLSREKLIVDSGHKYFALTILSEHMISNDMNVEKITDLHRNLFEEILRLIQVNLKSKVKPTDFKSVLRNLLYEINITYLVELLKKWEGWTSYGQHYTRDDLLSYLKSNHANFKLLQSSLSKQVLGNFFKFENTIEVTCSLKQLQALFYYDPKNYRKSHPDKILKPPRWLKPSLSKHVIIWPHVSTRITLPEFSLTHRNNHFDEYTLINIKNRLSLDKHDTISIILKPVGINVERHLKRNVVKFLNQLRILLINIVSDNVTIEKRSEIITALTIYENDLTNCPDVLESNCLYSWNIVSYPYARYLGCSDKDDIYLSMKDQIGVKNTLRNVRLQQIRYPNTSLMLNNFNVPHKTEYENINFMLDKIIQCDFNQCMTYNCLLCDVYFGSTTQALYEHFSQHHGLEPDWECTECLTPFTNDYLLNNNWKHNCP